MEFTNERDKKGRLSYVFSQEDAAEVIAEIVQDSQKAVVGALAGDIDYSSNRRRTSARNPEATQCRPSAIFSLSLSDVRSKNARE